MPDFRTLHSEARYFCEHCNYEFVAYVECGDRLCPTCNAYRRKRIIERYAEVLAEMKSRKFLTLTLKRRALCRRNVKFLRKCFTKLRQRKVWKPVRGGLYQIEIGTLDDIGQCNLHIHAVIDSDYICQDTLSKAWKKITGDSKIIHIKAGCGTRLLDYMTKHMVKMPMDLPVWQHELVNRVMEGVKLIQGFGYLTHLPDLEKEKEPRHCPQCGAVDSFVLYRPWEPTHAGL